MKVLIYILVGAICVGLLVLTVTQTIGLIKDIKKRRAKKKLNNTKIEVKEKVDE